MFLLQFIQVCFSFQVLGNISKIEGNTVEFEGRKESTFDAIVFATGYKAQQIRGSRYQCQCLVLLCK